MSIPGDSQPPYITQPDLFDMKNRDEFDAVREAVTAWEGQVPPAPEDHEAAALSQTEVADILEYPLRVDEFTAHEHVWVPLVYGMPDPTLFAAMERGEVVLGGCIVGETMPTQACRICNTTRA